MPSVSEDTHSKAAGNLAVASTDGITVRIRMYRPGLGDCFLISLLRPSGHNFYIMIDCGVMLGTPDAADRLRIVLDDIIETTGGRVDVLAVTHEHYDHVAGYQLAKEKFATPGVAEAKVGEKTLGVGEVWFAWTEDPRDQVATVLREQRRSSLNTLAALADGLGADQLGAARAVSGALSFFGAAKGAGLGTTAEAMLFAASLAPPGKVHYQEPGGIIVHSDAPELRVYVLGPPKNPAQLKRLDAATGLYRLSPDELTELVSRGAGNRDDMAKPFDRSWSVPLSRLSASAPTAEFLRARYYGPASPTPEADVTWRRIDGAWLGGACDLALALDSATNNTSLALAIEIVETGEVLLFPADAQFGNWISWFELRWDKPGCATDVGDLMARTVFYKVGHHGSHNATLKEKGVEKMKDGLTAFIPVDQRMADAKGWHRMPLDALLKALEAKSGRPPVRLDETPRGAPFVTAGGSWGRLARPPYDTLYIDWVRGGIDDRGGAREAGNGI